MKYALECEGFVSYTELEVIARAFDKSEDMIEGLVQIAEQTTGKVTLKNKAFGKCFIHVKKNKQPKKTVFLTVEKGVYRKTPDLKNKRLYVLHKDKYYSITDFAKLLNVSHTNLRNKVYTLESGIINGLEVKIVVRPSKKEHLITIENGNGIVFKDLTYSDIAKKLNKTRSWVHKTIKNNKFDEKTRYKIIEVIK